MTDIPESPSDPPSPSPGQLGLPGLFPSTPEKRAPKAPKPPMPVEEPVANQIAKIVSQILNANDPLLNEQWCVDLVRATFEALIAKRQAEEVRTAQLEREEKRRMEQFESESESEPDQSLAALPPGSSEPTAAAAAKITDTSTVVDVAESEEKSPALPEKQTKAGQQCPPTTEPPQVAQGIVEKIKKIYQKKESSDPPCGRPVKHRNQLFNNRPVSAEEHAAGVARAEAEWEATATEREAARAAQAEKQKALRAARALEQAARIAKLPPEEQARLAADKARGKRLMAEERAKRIAGRTDEAQR